MELDALDGEGLVAYAHDGAVIQLTRHLQHIGQAFTLDNERVVAGDLRMFRNTLIEPRAAVADGGCLAVDDFSRTDDASAEDLADGLMPKADAENRDLAAELTNDLLGDARVLRNTRTRRYDDAVVVFRANLIDGNFVAADDLDLRADVAEQLIDVIGKGVVVIKQKQHCSRPPLPPRREPLPSAGSRGIPFRARNP